MKIDEYINLLEDRFSDFINESDDRIFFLGLYDYVDLLESNVEVEKILNTLVEEQKNAEKSMLKAEQDAIDDLTDMLNKLKKFIKKNKLAYSSVKIEFDEFQMLLSGNMRGGASLVSNLSRNINRITDQLYIDVNDKKLKSSLKKDKNSSVILPPSVEHYVEKEKVYNSISSVNIWTEYEDLIEVYWMMKDGTPQYTKLYKEFGPDGKLDYHKRRKADYIKSVCYEWECIKEGRKPTWPVLFKKKEMHLAAKRLHRYLVAELHKRKSVDNATTVQIQPIKKQIYFSEARGLYIEPYQKEKSYPAKGEKRFKILKTILTNVNKGKPTTGPQLLKVCGYKDYSLLNREIKDINNLVRKSLVFDQDLIVSAPRSGFTFHENAHVIKA